MGPAPTEILRTINLDSWQHTYAYNAMKKCYDAPLYPDGNKSYCRYIFFLCHVCIVQYELVYTISPVVLSYPSHFVVYPPHFVGIAALVNVQIAAISYLSQYHCRRIVNIGSCSVVYARFIVLVVTLEAARLHHSPFPLSSLRRFPISSMYRQLLTRVR